MEGRLWLAAIVISIIITVREFLLSRLDNKPRGVISEILEIIQKKKKK